MERRTGIHWLSACIITCLVTSVDCSPLSRFPGYAWSEVGRQAVLPCSCRTYVSPTAQAPYILWQTVSHTVFERMGKDSVQGESYENRADVPMEMLAEGNCSLILSDVRFRDAGIYESYLVVGQSRVKNQILIHSVRLAVVDHKHIQSVKSGKDLILDLYTNQAKMLVFQQEGTPEWRVLWQRGQDSGGERWVEERGRKLVVREVVTSNSGTYRVVDEEGLTLSTVKVSVTGSVATTESEVKEKQISLDSGKVDAPSLCLIVVMFLSSHALIHLP